MKANHRGKKSQLSPHHGLKRYLRMVILLNSAVWINPHLPFPKKKKKKDACGALPSALRFASCANAWPVLPVPQLHRRRGFEAGRLGDGALDLAGRGPGVPHHRLGGFFFGGGDRWVPRPPNQKVVRTLGDHGLPSVAPAILRRLLPMCDLVNQPGPFDLPPNHKLINPNWRPLHGYKVAVNSNLLGSFGLAAAFKLTISKGPLFAGALASLSLWLGSTWSAFFLAGCSRTTSRSLVCP